MTNHTSKIISGSSWHYSFKFLSAIIALVKISILARLLSPYDFGIFSLVLIALGLTESFTETGINTTIIQSKQSVKYFLNTAWVISILRGILIAVIMLVLGIFMSHYYQDQILLFLIAIASLIPIVRGFINPYIVIFYKQMAFISDTMYRLSLVIINALFSIGLVYIYRSVYSLILAILFTAIFELTISFLLFKVKPRFEFIKSRADTIFKNTKWLSISAFLSYINENIDNFLVGKISGTVNLGYYQNAYALTHKPYEMAQAIYHSTLPVYTRLSKKRLFERKTVLKVLVLSMLLIVLGSSPLFIFPKYLILLILGNQWLPSIPLIRILLAAAVLQSISRIAYAAFTARKHYLIMNAHLFVTVIVLIASILYLGAKFSLIGAVWGVFLSRAISLPIIIFGLVYKSKNAN